MAGRRAQPPGPVPALSLAATGHPPTDRVNKQVESAVQDLQTKARDAASGISALTARVTTLEGEVSGRLLAAPIRLTGTGSGTLPAGTCLVDLEGVGGGGGGGGANGNGGGNIAAAAGGSSGVRLHTRIGTPGVPFTTLAYSWSAGAGGGGGNGTPTNGAVGGDTTVTLNGTAYTMKGGGGGAGATGIAGSGNYAPTAPAGGTSGVAGESSYGNGENGIMIGGAAWFSGSGGETPMGAGGLSVGGTTNGVNGAGMGGGGSGAAASGAGTATGGNGAAGGAFITPYS
jgi:hypothetical protein